MTKRKLQSLINAALRAHNAVHKADAALVRYCNDRWGFEPADHDLDNIIDGCMGGCGHSMEFSADEFIREMDATDAHLKEKYGD